MPIYLGLPNRPYKVLGRVYDDRTSGIGVMGRAFSEGLFSERDRQRDCADQAKYRAGTRWSSRTTSASSRDSA